MMNAVAAVAAAAIRPDTSLGDALIIAVLIVGLLVIAVIRNARREDHESPKPYPTAEEYRRWLAGLDRWKPPR